MIKIEAWSDFVCPFCYIGKRRLEEAIQASPYGNQVEVEYKAYELDPTAPEVSDEPYHVGLAKKYSMTEEKAIDMMNNVAEQAKTVGLDYNNAGMTPANTFKAHRLAKYAATVNKQNGLTERLLKAYFIEGQKIGDNAVLIALAKEVGLDEQAVEAVLTSEQYTEDVRNDIALAGQIGVRGVPFFVINRKYAVSGAQPVEAFVQAIEKVAEEEGLQPSLQVLGDDSGLCGDDGCSI